MVFPAQYGAVATLLKFTRRDRPGGGRHQPLMTAFFQAADDYSCLPWLGAGLVGYVAALLAGWRVGGISGLAVGGALGALAALAPGWAIAWCAGDGHGVARAGPPGGASGGGRSAGRAAAVSGAVAGGGGAGGTARRVRFVRPGARHARPPRWAAPGNWRTDEEPAVSVLIDAVWRGTARKATDAELRQALVLARRNRVEGRLASLTRRNSRTSWGRPASPPSCSHATFTRWPTASIGRVFPPC